MSDQPTANIEDTDVWHDANSYYGDEMTFDVSAARQRAEQVDIAVQTLDGTLPYEETWRVNAEAVVALADRVEAAETSYHNGQRIIGELREKLGAAEARVAELEKALAEIVRREKRSEYSSIYAAPAEFATVAADALSPVFPNTEEEDSGG